MQVTLLKSIISSFAGTNASGIVDLLYGKKNVNEFLIAKKLNLTINQTRNILYKLADEGLVSFVRKKDNKKGGWYTYFWTLNSGKSLLKFRDTMDKTITSLRSQLQSRKQGRFYLCKNCHLEFNEEQALLHTYACPECGEVLEVKDTSAEIQELEREIAKLEQALSKVNDELKIINHKEDQARTRRMKADERKRKKERAARQKLAQKARQKSVLKKTKTKGSQKRKKR
ncbi:hypothetical protein HYZ97_00230 [Candidatus Pacearchaeota archaeon]|nr:hypothetical protein [Candidatus Pacearchaeota archaeon]